MLDQTSIDALYKAAKNKFQITINYTKATTGEVVTHTGGIQEIMGNVLWLWDTTLNDSIRRFYIDRINSLQVLNLIFLNPNGYPIKINGEILGY